MSGSKRISLGLALILGLLIGSGWQVAKDWREKTVGVSQGVSQTENQPPSLEFVVSPEGRSTPAEITYRFGLKGGGLSVIEETPGTGARIIAAGFSAETWPRELLDLATQVEFSSLDEVQSFIDTATEHIVLE